MAEKNKHYETREYPQFSKKIERDAQEKTKKETEEMLANAAWMKFKNQIKLQFRS